MYLKDTLRNFRFQIQTSAFSRDCEVFATVSPHECFVSITINWIVEAKEEAISRG